MQNTIVQLVLLVAILLLSGSLWAIHRVRRILPEGKLRTAWTCLGATLLSAIFGCALFFYTNDMEGGTHHEDWLIAFTLFVAAVFVFGVCVLALSTARDLARIEDLERAAFFDPVTSLYTRGHIDSLLMVECEKSRSETSQLSVMIMDIDDFKFINDCFSHRAGDFVLRELGRILRQNVDSTNLVGRYGGEEFLIVFPNTAPVVAEEAAERIRLQVFAAHIEFEGSVIPVTVSIGVKTTFTFREAAKELVADADIAMYEAKRCGRNRVVMADRTRGAEVELPMGEVSNLIHARGQTQVGSR